MRSNEGSQKASASDPHGRGVCRRTTTLTGTQVASRQFVGIWDIPHKPMLSKGKRSHTGKMIVTSKGEANCHQKVGQNIKFPPNCEVVIDAHAGYRRRTQNNRSQLDIQSFHSHTLHITSRISKTQPSAS
jgi:hypothetical protein